MSPSHNRRSAPALSDDDIISVLLRIPPDDPARLVRASLACKAWRRILTSPDFCRLYREFHRTPPLLGLVVSSWSRNMTYASRFVPTTAFHLKSYHDFYPGRNWKAVDSRHGRILVEPVGDDQDDGLSIGGYFVWDPITNGQWGVPSPRIPTDTSLESSIGAVLCAKEHCDHLGCHGPPFLVAMVASHYGATFACVYSSESGVWSHIVTLEHGVSIDSEGCSILVGNTLNFPLAGIYGVLQYKLGEQKLSVIDLPDNFPDDESLLFISVEDDVLVFAGWRGTKLSIWSIEAGALAWTQRKVIDLEKLLPPRAFEPKIDDNGDKYMPNLSAYAEGTVFLSTMAGLFTVDLDSGRTNKVADEEMAINVTPWMSFYTQDHARRVLPLS